MVLHTFVFIGLIRSERTFEVRLVRNIRQSLAGERTLLYHREISSPTEGRKERSTSINLKIMRIISVCSDDRSSRSSESEVNSTSDRDHLMSRSPNLNVFDNLTDKKCEKYLTVVVNPIRFHRNMASRYTRNIERNDRSINASTSGNTVRSLNGSTIQSWQSCDDNKSTPDLSKNNLAPEEDIGNSRRRTLREKLVKGLCLAGWILCCPCCIVGFVLREPPETEADLDTDPCWPFSS